MTAESEMMIDSTSGAEGESEILSESEELSGSTGVEEEVIKGGIRSGAAGRRVGKRMSQEKAPWKALSKGIHSTPRVPQELREGQTNTWGSKRSTWVTAEGLSGSPGVR